MKSAIYAGTVRHRRFAPVAHEFRYPIYLMYLDLDELPQLFEDRWFWSARRPAFAWFRRGDYLGTASLPLDEAVRTLVAARTGVRPDGPIRLLTHLRYAGFVMNPVSFYYCFDAQDRRLEFVVAEVTNTPWRERHAYVVDCRTTTAGGVTRRRFPKAHHVSPFLTMEQEYDWRLATPGPRLAVHMENRKAGRLLFDATLALRRREISGRALARVLVEFPLMTVRVGVGIYWQAFRLWRKRVPFVPHPSAREVPS
jgi:DUF1365 family protein